jgi:hypothetical protein
MIENPTSPPRHQEDKLRALMLRDANVWATRARRIFENGIDHDGEILSADDFGAARGLS